MEVSRVETKACFSCRGTHDFTREGFLKCPARDKICLNVGSRVTIRTLKDARTQGLSPTRSQSMLKL